VGNHCARAWLRSAPRSVMRVRAVNAFADTGFFKGRLQNFQTQLGSCRWARRSERSHMHLQTWHGRCVKIADVVALK
jgi:hypothetical protein